MVYTLTLNPALDYIIGIEKLEKGKINRVQKQEIQAGGKGINVSIVLKNLGIENIAIGYIAGFTGDELKRKIEEKGIQTEFIKLKKGQTRINIKIKTEEETAINAEGPEVEENEENKLIEKIKKFNSKDTVIISGNIPKKISKNIYEKICEKLKEKGINYIVDATKEQLINILKYEPFLIKPNKEEIEETFKVNIKTRDELIEYAKKLQEMGAKNVLISQGGEGAILITENQEIIHSKAPKGQVINTVGAGDSMVAGFVASYKKEKDYEKALKMGIAAGSATAFSMELATKQEIEKLLKQI